MTSPSLVNATIEGVVRSPSEFSMTLATPPSMTATHELVVPRSMPMILPMTLTPLLPCLMRLLAMHLMYGRVEIFQAENFSHQPGSIDGDYSALTTTSAGRN